MQRNFRLLSASAVALTLMLVEPAAATTLNGSLTFGGGSTNFFNPANGFVPGGYGNSSSANGVTVGSGVEFGFYNFVNLDIADFSATGFTLSDISFAFGAAPFTMQFTANDGYFKNFSLLSDTFGGAFSTSADGNVFTYNAPGDIDLPQVRSAVFGLAPGGGVGTPAVPEPATWAMMLAGFGAIGFAMRRKQQRPMVNYNFA